MQKIEHLFILRSFSADYYSLIIQIPTTFKLSAISNMSVSMIHTIAFAKWFLNKHRASGILVDGADFEFILSQLDQSSWEEFIATADSIAISKTTADTLIPQLVEKMPKKPRAKNTEKKETKPKGKKTKDVDVQTSADAIVNDTPVLENGEAVLEKPLLKNEVKKRGPKAAKKIEEVVVPANTEEEVTVQEQPLLKKEVKKRGPKAVKKDVVVVDEDNHKKKSIVAPDDVVIPMNEQTILGGDLQEDLYQDDVELTEVFIDEVLFYKDANGNWFDALLTPTSDPTL